MFYTRKISKYIYKTYFLLKNILKIFILPIPLVLKNVSINICACVQKIDKSSLSIVVINHLIVGVEHDIVQTFNYIEYF